MEGIRQQWSCVGKHPDILPHDYDLLGGGINSGGGEVEMDAL